MSMKFEETDIRPGRSSKGSSEVYDFMIGARKCLRYDQRKLGTEMGKDAQNISAQVRRHRLVPSRNS